MDMRTAPMSKVLSTRTRLLQH
uniref:Uncharacterized protein n=1 Tax=Arundo donax TaxID=35708 RepID=A0A0A8Y878_ARUDO